MGTGTSETRWHLEEVGNLADLKNLLNFLSNKCVCVCVCVWDTEKSMVY